VHDEKAMCLLTFQQFIKNGIICVALCPERVNFPQSKPNAAG